MAKIPLTCAAILAIFCCSGGALAKPYEPESVVSTLLARDDLPASVRQFRENCIHRSGSDLGFNISLTSLVTDCRADLAQLSMAASSFPVTWLQPQSFSENSCSKIQEWLDCSDGFFEGVALCVRRPGDDVKAIKYLYRKVIEDQLDAVCKSAEEDENSHDEDMTQELL